MARPVLGEIKMLAGSGVPPGWAACDGQELQIHEYRELYAVIGTTYGGDGRATFALPDLRGKVAIHSNPGSMNPGATGGETTHRLTSTEVPGHAHGALGLISAGAASAGVRHLAVQHSTVSGMHAPATTIAPGVSSTSSGIAHDNLQPFLSLAFVIATHGDSPSRK